MVAAALFIGGSAAASAPGPRRVGVTPRLPAGSRVVGALDPQTSLKLTVALDPRDPAGLEEYASAVSTPGSSVYHQFLTVPEFKARFGATGAQIAAVNASLRSHGLHPGQVSANGLSIPVSATAGAIGRAFSTSISRATLASGRSAFVNTQPPLLDPSVAGLVQDVIGLDDVAVRHPAAVRATALRSRPAPRVVTGGPQPCAPASGVSAYTADAIASAYGLSGLYGAGDFAAGQTVALFELEPYSASNIATYQSCYGTTATVSNIPVDGGAGSGPGSGEAALDIENVIGLAPRVHLDVYEGPNPSGIYDTYSAIIVANSAKVVSTSWGLCEADTGASFAQAENTLFQEAATQGQTVFAAAGDNGSDDCTSAGKPLPAPAVDDPASQPYVTGVGGTSMPTIGPPPTESVWNNSAGAGGGGISTFWQTPPYQARVDSAGVREVPDVSADADPSTGYAIFYLGSWIAVGGTSAAAPLWSALMSEINASSTCNGIPIGFANPVLYATAAHVYRGHFNDVTSGNNDILGLNGGLYPAGPGYDMATGLGTPNAAALASNLCHPLIGLTLLGTQTSRVRTAANLQIVATDTAGYPVTFSATGLPPGLSIGSTNGLISGTTTTPGAYNVTLHAADTRGGLGTTGFNWTVQGLPSGSRGSLTGVAKGKPKLTFTLAAGASAPALHKIILILPKGLSFSRKGLKKGLTVNGSHRLAFKLSGAKLTITLRGSATRARVTIAPPALGASGSIRRGKKVKFKLQAIDASGFSTTIRLRLKAS